MNIPPQVKNICSFIVEILTQLENVKLFVFAVEPQVLVKYVLAIS
jgi:hypothetical protein